MSTNLNQTILAANITTEVNDNLGISNTSQSSKIRLLADSLSSEIFSIIQNTDEVVRRMYTSTAAGKFLDANGAEWNLFRGKVPSVNIPKEDATVFIVPSVTSEGFDDILIGRRMITAGESFEIGGKYKITILEDVVPLTKFTDIAAHIRLEPINDVTDFYVNEGSGFRPYNATNPYLDMFGVRFDSPISFDTIPVDDETFRAEIEKEKSENDVSSAQSVRNAVARVPGLNGYAVIDNEFGTGVVSVYMVTNDQVKIGEDLNYVTYLRYLKNALVAKIPGGVTIRTLQPNRLNLKVTYTKNDTTISDAIAKEMIKAAILDAYSYSETQIIDASVISNIIRQNYTFSKNLTVTEVACFDPLLNEIVIDYSQFLNLDHKSYISISTADMEPEQ